MPIIPTVYTIREASELADDAIEIVGFNSDDAACQFVQERNSASGEYPERTEVVVIGPDGVAVSYAVTLETVPSYNAFRMPEQE